MRTGGEDRVGRLTEDSLSGFGRNLLPQTHLARVGRLTEDSLSGFGGNLRPQTHLILVMFIDGYK